MYCVRFFEVKLLLLRKIAEKFPVGKGSAELIKKMAKRRKEKVIGKTCVTEEGENFGGRKVLKKYTLQGPAE